MPRAIYSYRRGTHTGFSAPKGVERACPPNVGGDDDPLP